jgi:hypothetical protein
VSKWQSSLVASYCDRGAYCEIQCKIQQKSSSGARLVTERGELRNLLIINQPPATIFL